MRYEWDERKRRVNLRKHGVDFRDAPQVFHGRTLTMPDDREDYGEDRFISIGLLGSTVVTIAHTERTGGVRIISMRKAKSYEEREYFAQVGYGLEADRRDEGQRH